MSKIELNTSIADYGFSQINANFQKIEDELNQKVFYRDNPVGEPNGISNTVDANNQDIINVKDLHIGNELFIQGNSLQEAIDAAAGGVGADAAASAAAAASSASSASSSASSASTSASNAAASYDSFDDRYLGAKNTPPTVDNDGNPLMLGALYWDNVLSPGGSFPATDITVTPTGNIGSTTVQAALAELDSEKAKLNGDAAVAFSASTFTGALTGNVTGNTTGAHNGTVGATTPNTVSATTIVASGTITPSQTNGIVGTTTNNNANAGSVGEYTSSTVLVGSAVALTSNTPANITTLSLSAGDWEVWGSAHFNPAVSTTSTANYGWISTTSAAFPTPPNNGALFAGSYSITTGQGDYGWPVGRIRLSLSATTTVYLSCLSLFGTSTNAAYGFLAARRVR